MTRQNLFLILSLSHSIVSAQQQVNEFHRIDFFQIKSILGGPVMATLEFDGHETHMNYSPYFPVEFFSDGSFTLFSRNKPLKTDTRIELLKILDSISLIPIPAIDINASDAELQIHHNSFPLAIKFVGDKGETINCKIDELSVQNNPPYRNLFEFVKSKRWYY